MSQGLAISTVLLWIVVLSNLLLTLAIVRRLNPQTAIQSGLKVGQQAPAFAAGTLEGETVTLADYIGSGKEALFIFIGTGCAPCRQALPDYVGLFPKADHAGIALALVSTNNKEQTKVFASEFSLDIPVIVADREDSSFIRDYKVTGTPSFCHIDRHGKVKAAGHPNENNPDWRALVESLP